MENYRYVWAVAYVNRTFLPTVFKDLQPFEDEGIRAYIPTVRVLRKQFKNKKHFEEVPLLFNYGFFRLPFHRACDKDFLMRMKVSVNVIYNWLYNNSIPEKDEEGRYFNSLKVETVKVREIAFLKRACLLNSIYSSDDVSKFGKGDYIVLHGYPFENIPAEILSVNAKKEEVRVRLLVNGDSVISEVTVNFSNIFYSIYSNFDEPNLTDSTLEGLAERSKSGMDKLLYDGTEN